MYSITMSWSRDLAVRGARLDSRAFAVIGAARYVTHSTGHNISWPAAHITTKGFLSPFVPFRTFRNATADRNANQKQRILLTGDW